jgi:hypothetical protein
MELVWCIVTVGPPFLIVVGGYRLLSTRTRLPSPIIGLLCGSGAGFYLYALGAIAFSQSVTAWAPGLLFQVHTILGATLFGVVDTLLGAPSVGAASRWHFLSSYGALLLIQGALAVICYGLAGMLIGVIARRG